MLLWETLSEIQKGASTLRLPGDLRCAALKKSGLRCKGRVLRNGEFCAFHDPQAQEARRGKRRSPARQSQYHLDGIPSRLTTRRGVTLALDRLYNDTRTGLIQAEAGQVLFGMLERMLDGHVPNHRKSSGRPDRSRAAVLRRRLARIYISTDRKYRGAMPSGGQGRTRPTVERREKSVAHSPDRAPGETPASGVEAPLLGAAVPSPAT